MVYWIRQLPYFRWLTLCHNTDCSLLVFSQNISKTPHTQPQQWLNREECCDENRHFWILAPNHEPDENSRQKNSHSKVRQLGEVVISGLCFLLYSGMVEGVIHPLKKFQATTSPLSLSNPSFSMHNPSYDAIFGATNLITRVRRKIRDKAERNQSF